MELPIIVFACICLFCLLSSLRRPCCAYRASLKGEIRAQRTDNHVCSTRSEVKFGRTAGCLIPSVISFFFVIIIFLKLLSATRCTCPLHGALFTRSGRRTRRASSILKAEKVARTANWLSSGNPQESCLCGHVFFWHM